MAISPSPTDSVFDVPREVDLFPSLPGPRIPADDDLDVTSLLPEPTGEGALPGSTSPGPRKRTRRGVGERRVVPQGRDYALVLLLARCRYLTAPQIMRALWPREEMPPRQTVHHLLGRLARLGWVEKRTPLDTRWPVYQLTSAGHEVASMVNPSLTLQRIAHPAAATLEHTLAVNDLVILWERGRGWLPDGFEVGRVVSEREITAVDKQPPRLPEKYQNRQRSQVLVAPGGGGVQNADEPVYGYLTIDGRRGFPDALLLPAGAQGVQGAIAVEYQRTLKEVRDFASVLLGYRRTAERTGRYAHVLYVSPDQGTLNNVTAAAAEVGAEHLLITRLAPRPLWKEWPARTTPLQPKRPREESEWERWQRVIPKQHRHLVPGYIRAGWSPEAAAEHLAS